MSKVITVFVRDLYGRKVIYPVCAEAKLLCDLTGRKTFMPRDLVTLKQLNYVINYETQTIEGI